MRKRAGSAGKKRKLRRLAPEIARFGGISVALDERRELARVPLKNKNSGDLVLPNYRNRKTTRPLAN
jgi:hypothetical protein